MNTIPELVADKLLGGLWSAQLEVWPDSVRITSSEAAEKLSIHQNGALRWGYVNDLYARYPDGFFYTCGVSFGFRYGPRPEDYLSY